MSDFCWVICELSDSEYKQLVPFFKKTTKIVDLTDKQKEVLSLSESKPEQLVPEYIPKELLPKKYDKNIYKNGIINNEKMRIFSSIFKLKDIDVIFHKLPLTDETLIKFESFNEYPFAILSYSLGVAEVAKIPGLYGNIMIPHGELKNSLSLVNSVINKRNSNSLSKARKVYSCCSAGKETNEFDNEINELFSLLPSALEEAINRKVNIISLCFWMG